MHSIKIPVIPAEHWQFAKEYLKHDGDKLPRSVDKPENKRQTPKCKRSASIRLPYIEKETNKTIILEHSFIRVAGKVFAIIRGETIEVGAINRVKYCIDEENKLYVIRIKDEAQLSKNEEHAKYLKIIEQETNISLDVGIYVGFASRTDNLTREGVEKEVCILPFKGIDLYNFYTKDPKNLCDRRLCVIAFKCMRELRLLHEGKKSLKTNKPIIHCDVALENFLVDIKGQVSLIDFGFARYADKYGKVKHVFACGRNEHLAPEVKSQFEYSSGSDIFSLGISFAKLLDCRQHFLEAKHLTLKFTEVTRKFSQLVRKMLNPDPGCRPSLAFLEVALLTILIRPESLARELRKNNCVIQNVEKAMLLTHYFLGYHQSYSDKDVINHIEQTLKATTLFNDFIIDLPPHQQQPLQEILATSGKVLRFKLTQCFRQDYSQRAASLLSRTLLYLMVFNRDVALLIVNVFLKKWDSTSFRLVKEVIDSHKHEQNRLCFNQHYPCELIHKIRLQALGVFLNYSRFHLLMDDKYIELVNDNQNLQKTFLLINSLSPAILQNRNHWAALIDNVMVTQWFARAYNYLHHELHGISEQHKQDARKFTIHFVKNVMLCFKQATDGKYDLQELNKERFLWNKSRIALDQILIKAEEEGEQQQSSPTDVTAETAAQIMFTSPFGFG